MGLIFSALEEEEYITRPELELYARALDKRFSKKIDNLENNLIVLGHYLTQKHLIRRHSI